MDRIRMTRLTSKFYNDLCPACKKDAVVLVHRHSRGGKTDTKAVVEKLKEITCNECKARIEENTRKLLAIMKKGKGPEEGS